MLAKPVMVTEPVAVLLYDRAYISGTFREALVRRSYLYVGLASTWLLLLAVLMSPHESSHSAGAGAGLLSPAAYMLTQTKVILHYLRLVFQPTRVCLDYAWEGVVSWREAVLPGVVLPALLGTALWTFIKRWGVGFPAVFFFLVLAPSSSFIPVADCAFDHRMYLALAGVIAVVVLGLHRLLCGRVNAVVLLGVACLVVAGLAVMTRARNVDYQDPDRMWLDVVAKRPGNLRAHEWLAASMLARGALDEAEAAARRILGVVESLPDRPGSKSKAYHLTLAYDRLGRILASRGRYDEAIECYRNALVADPGNRVAHCNMAVAFLWGLSVWLAQRGAAEQAVRNTERPSTQTPKYPRKSE